MPAESAPRGMYIACYGTVLVPLWGNGTREFYALKGWALVSESDADLVAPYRWHLAGWYAHCRDAGYLHRLIVGLPKHQAPDDPRITDHINRVTLDNRRENLRVTDHAGNMRNRRRPLTTKRFRAGERPFGA